MLLKRGRLFNLIKISGTVFGILMIGLSGGCGVNSTGSDTTTAAISVASGDAARGEALFNGAAACSTCHVVDSEKVLVGPGLKGVGVAAASREPGVSAEQYLIESILYPNKYLVVNYSEGLMPQTYKESRTPAEIADLVAYMLTLK